MLWDAHSASTGERQSFLSLKALEPWAQRRWPLERCQAWLQLMVQRLSQCLPLSVLMLCFGWCSIPLNILDWVDEPFHYSHLTSPWPHCVILAKVLLDASVSPSVYGDPRLLGGHCFNPCMDLRTVGASWAGRDADVLMYSVVLSLYAWISLPPKLCCLIVHGLWECSLILEA